MSDLTPPKAAKKDHFTTHHGIERNDPYHWLRDDNWQQVMREPESLDNNIRAYLEAENEYFEAHMDDSADLREKNLHRDSRTHQGR